MVNYSKRHLLLLIDFDDSYPDRWQIYQDKKAALPAASLWQHAHLQHNAGELARLVAQVRPFLFQL